MNQYYVYILTNNTNSVLYVGVTNSLIRRIHEHKQKVIEGFTKKYNCTKLVYFDETNDVNEALNEEKRIKNWRRSWKFNLIKEYNSELRDLSTDFNFDFSLPLDAEINSA